MAEFYKGFRRDQVSQQGAVALAAPSTQVAQQSNQIRTQLLTQGIENLVNAGSKVIQSQDIKRQEKMALKGATQAGEGKENSASVWTWGGEAQTKAYNSVRGQSAVRDLPSYVDTYFKNNSDKPLDEMSTEERNMKYAEAREQFFKEKGLDGAAFRSEAAMAATQLQENHLRYMDKQAADLRQAKSETLLQDSVGDLIRSTQGSPTEIESMLSAKMDEFSVMVGSSLKAQELIADGLLNEVVSADPAASLAALDYLKTPEAKKRFSEMEDFDRVVKQAEVFNQKKINQIREEREQVAENGFYSNLMGGSWGSLDQAKAWINETPFEPKKKFEMIQLAKRHIDTSNAADGIQDAVNTGQFNVFNAQKKEVREELFARNVGGPEEFNLNNIQPQQVQALASWIKKGFDVPDYIKKIGTSDVGNGEWEQNVDMEAGRPPKALNNQLKLYHDLSVILGDVGVGSVFDSRTQAKMEYITTLTKGVVAKPEEFQQRLNEFDRMSKSSLYGESRLDSIRRELTDPNTSKKLQSWAKEGGKNVFGGPDDLQPFFTFSDMGSNPESVPSLDYAKDSVTANYAFYRLTDMEPDEAMRRAQADFQTQNQWVTFNKGATKHTYIPKEYPTDFVDKAYEYMDKTQVTAAIATRYGETEETARKHLTVQPSSDYKITRRMSVYYKGVETELGFVKDEFDNFISPLAQEELDRITREDELRRNSPEFQQRKYNEQRLGEILKSLKFR